MKKYSATTKIIIIVSLFFSLFTSFVKADTTVVNVPSQTPTPPAQNASSPYTLLAPLPGMTTAPTSIGDYFNAIFLIIIGICAVLAVIMIIIGGIQYMGNESIFG